MQDKQKEFRAICINDTVQPWKVRKYNKVHNKPGSLKRFENFILNAMGTGTNVNYYGRESQKFEYQVKL